MSVTYSSDSRFILTAEGQDQIKWVISPEDKVEYQWSILQLCLDGALLETAEVIDSFVSLVEACQAATELNRRAKLAGEPFTFLVQRYFDDQAGGDDDNVSNLEF